MTHAEHHVAWLGHGRWRKATRAHPCDHFYTRRCVGTGQIEAGERYFDTEEPIGHGFDTNRTCEQCAIMTHYGRGSARCTCGHGADDHPEPEPEPCLECDCANYEPDTAVEPEELRCPVATTDLF